MTTTDDGIDPVLFRQVLGRYPTGVAVITAIDGTEPVGMVVGSFTSVSLDPPLVAYLPARTSQSYQRLHAVDRFCVNVVSVEQADMVRRFASRGVEKWWHCMDSHRASFRVARSDLELRAG